MRLAKPFFDVGLVTSNITAVEQHWRDELQLRLNHELHLGPGHIQHRYDLSGSVLKLNSRSIDSSPPGGYHSLIVARNGIRIRQDGVDPDGNRYELVAEGEDLVTQIGIRMKVRDVAEHRRFYANALQFPQVAEDSFRVGEGLIILEQDSNVATDTALWGPGWRYLTFQIFDVLAVHMRILAEGGREAMPVMQLANVSRASVILDPDGNAIELSQRADLAGPLDDRMVGTDDPMGDVGRSRAASNQNR